MKFMDKLFPVGMLVENLPYMMVFKTTNYCWFQCPHCCESSGPDQPRQFIDLDAVNYYLYQATRDERFDGNVVFTGGEIMSAYRFGDPQYVPNLLNMCLDANIGTDIKTNAGWARTSFGEQIYTDLLDVINRHDGYALQISLSLDGYHKNCMENNVALLQRLARARAQVGVNIAMFGRSGDVLLTEMMRRLSHAGVRVETGYQLHGDIAVPIFRLNQTVVIQYGGPDKPMANGRAKNLADAKPTKFPQFAIMNDHGSMLMAFDSFGYVTLGENSGDKIKTKWRTGNGDFYKFGYIKSRLLMDARIQEARARLFDGWRWPQSK